MFSLLITTVEKVKIFQLIQGPLVAVTVGIIFQIVTSKYFPEISIKAKHLVTVPVAESFTGFTQLFSFPNFSAISNPEVWIVAITIAVVASLETLLSVEATDKLDPHKRTTNTNRELLAQGSGNIISGLIGFGMTFIPAARNLLLKKITKMLSVGLLIGLIAYGILI